MNNRALFNLSYGVYIISTWDNGRPTGCVANSAMQITSDPATIAISINHNNYTHKCLTESGRFAISIVSEKTDPKIIGTFGYQSGETVNKFDEVDYEIKGMLPVIKDSCGYLTCEIIDQMDTSSHTVFLGKIVDADLMEAADPMTYSYYHKVIKGKSPKNAPTYIAE
ncbi:flavin reductase family protein [Anaerosporobacter faecicola]|uniref:flavin reductase family protein n=1 Tax=Anaerosporobacter faecicola TaxID=2718714 RepID=UPI00143A4319